jgi:hypothetical protein
MERNSSQGAFLRTLRLEGEKIFLTAACLEASVVAFAVSRDIPHLFDKLINVNRDFRSLDEANAIVALS